MTDVKGGRHCESCSKTVVDFTGMSNDQIINYLSVSRNVCGRIHEQQMESVNLQLIARQPQNKGGWAKWVMAAALFAGTVYNRANAQTAPQLTEQTDIVKPRDPDFPLGKIAMPDSLKYQTITGIVVDGDDRQPLPGVSVFTDDRKAGTQTNNDGTFTIRIPASAKTIIVSFVGYERQVIKLRKIKTSTIQLKLKPAIMGGLGVTRPSLLSQLYARLVSGFGQGKFNREI
jgi:hypothetical protein